MTSPEQPRSRTVPTRTALTRTALTRTALTRTALTRTARPARAGVGALAGGGRALRGAGRRVLRPTRAGWRRLALRTRAALIGAVVGLLGFGTVTLWVRDSLHEELLLKAQDQAFSAMQNISENLPAPPAPVYQGADYLMMSQDGRMLHRAGELAALPQRSDDQWAALFPPADPRDMVSSWGFPMTPVRLPTWMQDAPIGLKPDTLRTYHFLTFASVRDLTSAELAGYSGQSGLPAQRVTGYVLVDESTVDQATTQVTEMLCWSLLPGGALLAAATTWLTAGLALRPVESIRRRMARIGNGAFGERVPLLPSRDGIARLVVTTNETLDKLEHALAEQRRLVADASHELRSPLAVLRTTLEVPLLRPGPQGADWPVVVADALAGTERLQHLAEDLLLLARTDEAAEASQHSVDLHDLVEEQLAERGHTDPGLQWRGTVEAARVPGRDPLVGRVLRNLLDNAARYATSQVDVSLRTTDGWAVLTVADDGPGIPVADRQRVFERFVRLDSARARSTGGAGLGLALARGIARSLGGTVIAEPPDSGRGAQLSVRLPLAP
ncbi:HAMP domain-containing histidine kinase [Kitasatospora sp. NBC_01287]|uniref:sensor histidine kinase n=1 Tax=Kitasatospora sp. NBC_01287 TaxID=2903573 RepID=UPI00225B759C|nr:HAMP domain-containing sensor histidine kinase [Kitasatospora sp. NBC_01287]MCX4751077.1 HAMP domain-containing histidine kinase [Kitasatospora sp. NBC_01287]